MLLHPYRSECSPFKLWLLLGLSQQEGGDPFEAILKTPFSMLLGILVTIMINNTMFERREGFLPSWPAPPAALSSLGDLPLFQLTQLRAKATFTFPIAPLNPSTILLRTGHQVYVGDTLGNALDSGL